MAVVLDELEILKAILNAFAMALERSGVHSFPLKHVAEIGKAEKVLVTSNSGAVILSSHLTFVYIYID